MPATILTNAQLWAWLAVGLAAGFIVWRFNTHAAPWLKQRLDIDLQLDVETARGIAREALAENAALLVGLRHLRTAYVAGPLYGGK